MAVAAEELRERPVVVEETVARRIGRAATRLPLHLMLLFIGLLWLPECRRHAARRLSPIGPRHRGTTFDRLGS